MPIPDNPVLVEIWRGAFLESVHRGAAVVARADGAVVEAWGDAERVVPPRSACKMLQALPLVESGAADAAGLGPQHLALACASHSSAAMHTELAGSWLAGLGLGPEVLRCGAHAPEDREAVLALGTDAPSQLHNNCSGKHCGMVTVTRHMGAGPDYIEPDHPLQRSIRDAIAEMAGADPPGFVVDGCSAPNFALRLVDFATALARFAAPAGLGPARSAAVQRLREAMIAHPDLVAAPYRGATRLMRSAAGRAAVKSGAEGVYAAILPEKGLGIAVKIDDGASRGAEAVLTALMVRHGALEAGDPSVARYARQTIRNWRGIETGHLTAVESLW